MLRSYLAAVTAAGGLIAAGLIDAAAPAVVHSAAVVTAHTATGWTSGNWSGYAGTTGAAGSATSVQGSWTVPTVTSTPGNTYSSVWIGIDGFTNSNLIQTGTEEDWVGGHSLYQAWWEILPASETVIPSMTIHPGDHMFAQITKGSGTTWTIKLEDLTSSNTFNINKKYTGQADTIEWIVEAPTVGGGLASLAHYGQTTFINCGFNGGAAAFTTANRGVMVQGGKHVSTPSKPGKAGDDFTVAYGSKTPKPPAS
jgi:hypothetical protein